MKKLLLTLAAGVLSVSTLFAGEQKRWEVEFTNGNNNTGAAFSTTTALTDFITNGAEYISGIAETSKTSKGQYGLKVAENKNEGYITLNVAPAYQVLPTKVTIEASSNKANATRSFLFNGESCSTNTQNGTYTTITLENFTEPISSLSFKRTPTTSTDEGFIFIHKVTVEYVEGEAPSVESPVLSLVEGDYGFSVEMTTATEGADIYYTLDGTIPTTDSDKYAGPVEVWENCTVKAIAVLDGESSLVATAFYTIPYILDSFSMLNDMESGMKFIVKGNPIKVVYQNGSYLYVTCGGSYAILYGSNTNEYKNGDTFTRIAGTYSPYNGLPEIKEYEVSEVVEGTPVEPAIIPVDAAGVNMLNHYITFENVDYTSTAITDADGNTLAVREAQFKLYFDDMANANVTGFLGIYNNNLQFYPIEVSGGTEIVAAPVFTPAEGEVAIYSTITLTAEEGTEIYYKEDGDEEFELYEDGIMAHGPVGTTITLLAYAKKGEIVSETAEATFTVTGMSRNLAWLDAQGNPITELTVVFGEEFEMPMLDGNMEEPTITSSNPDVAVINDMMGIDIVGLGTTVITVSDVASGMFAAGEASFTLKVVSADAPKMVNALVTFTSQAISGYETTGMQSWKEYKAAEKSKDWVSDLDGYVFPTTVEVSGTSYPAIYANGDDHELRLYGAHGNVITVNAPEGYEICSADFELNTEYYALVIKANGIEVAKDEAPEVSTTAANTYAHSTYTFAEPVQKYTLQCEETNNKPQSRIRTISMTLRQEKVAVADVEINDENAPVEYYNLQGVRVAQPAAGLYIRRQGNTATKVLVK